MDEKQGNMFKAIKPHKITEEIIDQIKELIRTGELSPGDKLPPERELSRIFGVGRSSLREAISILDKGNVEVIAGINLPMLIKLASVRRSGTLAEAVDAAQESGRKYINVASQVLTGEASRG